MVGVLREIPALYLAGMLLVGTGKYFPVALFGATIFAMVYLVAIQPKLSCCEVKYSDFQEEEKEVEDRIKAFIESNGYADLRVKIVKKLNGSLHGNAHVNGNEILIVQSTLDQLRDQPD